MKCSEVKMKWNIILDIYFIYLFIYLFILFLFYEIWNTVYNLDFFSDLNTIKVMTAAA